jgi:hypothetical protein
LNNSGQIENALIEATVAWNALGSGFALSANSHYQLSNRFAFAWKVAKMGTPVVLLYLGFLDAQEMVEGSRTLLKDHVASLFDRSIERDDPRGRLGQDLLC